MRTTKYALGTALSLFALLASGAAKADTVFSVTGNLSCLNGPCPNNLSFAPGSTVTVDLTTWLATQADITIGGFQFLGVPNDFNAPNGFTWANPLFAFPSISLELDNPDPNLGLTPVAQLISLSAPNTELWHADGSYTLTPVPEPPTSWLLGTILVILLGMSLRRKRLA
jgi:hypothetical protein